MKTALFGLALALGMMPVATFAQDNNMPTLTDQQRQALHQTFEQYGQQEMQLHQQLRSQILSSLSPVHLRAVGATIGELAVSPNPNFKAAAQRIDQILSGAERARVMTLHSTFRAQSEQLHQQMKADLQRELPAGAEHQWNSNGQRQMAQHGPLDAGSILLFTLSGHGMGDMHHMEGGFFH
jgi:hypothetical protein